MENEEWGRKGFSKFRELWVWVATILVDTVFLILWLACHFAVHFVAEKLKTSNIINLKMLTLFQVIFAVSTLAPVVIYIYKDIRIMIIKAQREINQEKKLS